MPGINYRVMQYLHRLCRFRTYFFVLLGMLALLDNLKGKYGPLIYWVYP